MDFTLGDMYKFQVEDRKYLTKFLLTNPYGKRDNMKGVWLATVLAAATVYVDMYQDRNDPNNTVVVVTQDDEVTTFTVKTKDVGSKSFEDRVVKEVGHGIRQPTKE